MENEILSCIEEEKERLQKHLLHIEELKKSACGAELYNALQKKIESSLQVIDNLEFELLEQQIASEELQQLHSNQQQQHKHHENQLKDKSNEDFSYLSSVTTLDQNTSSSNILSSSSSSSLTSNKIKDSSTMATEDSYIMRDNPTSNSNYTNHEGCAPTQNSNQFFSNPCKSSQSNNYVCLAQFNQYFPLPILVDQKNSSQSHDKIQQGQHGAYIDEQYDNSPPIDLNNGRHDNSDVNKTNHSPTNGNHYIINNNHSNQTNKQRPWSISSSAASFRLNKTPSGISENDQLSPFTFTRNNNLSSSVRSRNSIKTNRVLCRPLTKYLPNPSDPTFNLRQFIELSGHNLALLDKYVTLTPHNCYGQLSKLSGKLPFKIWKKKHFIFDRNRRMLAYYASANSNKRKGLIPFDQIIETYSISIGSSSNSSSAAKSKAQSPPAIYRWGVLSNQNRSQHNDPINHELIFAVRLLDTWNKGRSFKDVLKLQAPTIEVKRLWMDVIFTGAEAYLKTLDATRNQLG